MLNMEQCYLAKIDRCVCSETTDLVNARSQRIQTIINCSRIYNDELYSELEAKTENNSEYSIYVHRSCVSTYTSHTHVERFLKRKGGATGNTSVSPMKRRRRSGTPKFDFQKDCLFCGDFCNLEKDPKHPDRWRKAYLCRSIGEGDVVDPKQDILNKCKERSDKWAEEVKLRIHGTVSDLHAADARYHVDCKGKFMTPKHVRLASASSSSKSSDTDPAFESVVSEMLQDRTRIWNSIDLYEQYSNEGGDKLTRRQLIESLTTRFGKDVIVLSATGVANIIVFREQAQ